MQELDQKLQIFGSTNVQDHPWFKHEDLSEDEQLTHPQFEIIEEHLEDNISYVDESDYPKESYDTNEFESHKIEDDSKDFAHIIIKDHKDDAMEDIIEHTEGDFDYDQTLEDDEKNDDFNNTSADFKDVCRENHIYRNLLRFFKDFMQEIWILIKTILNFYNNVHQHAPESSIQQLHGVLANIVYACPQCV
jgi:hypothetical protein